MSAFFGIAGLVDLVIVFTLLEGALLIALYLTTGKGVAPRDFILNMGSGLCLMLALRCLARDAGMAGTAACLLGAGMLHGLDLWLRWHGQPTRTSSKEVLQ